MRVDVFFVCLFVYLYYLINMMSEKFIRNGPLLKSLSNARKSIRNAHIASAKKEVIDVLVECAQKILQGVIDLTPAQYKRLSVYVREIRAIAAPGGLSQKKRLLQHGGILPLLIKPALGLLGGLLGPILGGR